MGSLVNTWPWPIFLENRFGWTHRGDGSGAGKKPTSSRKPSPARAPRAAGSRSDGPSELRKLLSFWIIAVGILLIPVQVLALCDGTGDDTLAVQRAISTRTPLPAGACMVSAGLTVGAGERLSGQGVSVTYILPIVSGLNIVTAYQAGAVVEDLQIGTPDWPYVSGVGLYAGASVPTDRILIRNVHITGKYSLAFLCQMAVSSRMDFVQIWNFMPNTMAAAWLACTDWTLTQVEVHQQADSLIGGAAVWLWYGSGDIRFFGGNISIRTGSGGQYVIGPNGRFYGTTFYLEP